MKIKFFNESGQSLIFVALGMTVMLGFVGFATDVGVLLHTKRQVQTAADSAAIAAALEAAAEGGPSTVTNGVKAAGQNDAALNGYTDSVNGATVSIVTGGQVSVPAFQGTGYFQATVTQNTPDFFMKLFGFNSMNVSATAIATDIGDSTGCVFVPNPGLGANPAFYLSGHSLLAGSNCGISINGNLQFNGGSATIDTGYLTASGSIGGNAGVSINGPYSAGSTYLGTPDSSLSFQNTQDSQPQPCAYGQTYCKASTPGTCYSPDGSTCYYDYGLNTSTGIATIGATTLNSGVYYYDVPVKLSIPKSATLSSAAGGVMFFLAGEQEFDFSSNGTVSLTGLTSTDSLLNNVLIDAPSDGPYTTCSSGNSGNPGEFHFDFGSSNSTLTGIIYAPQSQLFVQDNGATMTFNTNLIMGNICMQSAKFTINGLPQGSSYTKVGLVY